MATTNTPVIVLASSSPYRQELLRKLGLEFTAISPDVDETPLKGESPEALVKRLAETKARAVSAQFPQALIIGSDQVAILGNKILGKPGTHQRAKEQLKAASGERVSFLTGLCLLNSATGRGQVDIVSFNVQFRRLDDAQIENYLLKEKPYNCAGSFKSEGLGIALFAALEGEDPNALIGLPLIRLVDMLKTEGIDILIT
ncbi:septum formation inhibitor Maf [Candidatus Pacearchaeota archaeon]|nr:septum formation inhibitor Maf [Candidatus Pacearchaeota archaeon]